MYSAGTIKTPKMHKAACVINARYALEMRGSMYSSGTTKSPKMHPADAYNICNICAFPMLHVASGLRRENASTLFGFGNWINGVRMSGADLLYADVENAFEK